jgi:hypothetical protein
MPDPRDPPPWLRRGVSAQDAGILAARQAPPPPRPGSVQATFCAFPLSLTPGGWHAVAWVAHLVDIEPDPEMRLAFAARLCDIVRRTPVPVELFYRRAEIGAAMDALVPNWPARPVLSPDRRDFLHWLALSLPPEVHIDASMVGFALRGGFEPEDDATVRRPSR